MQARWVVWLGLTQLSMCALCAFFLWAERTPVLARTFGVLGIWYAIQAVDEALFGNFFGAGLWEYPALALHLAATLYLRRNDHA